MKIEDPPTNWKTLCIEISMDEDFSEVLLDDLCAYVGQKMAEMAAMMQLENSSDKLPYYDIGLSMEYGWD